MFLAGSACAVLTDGASDLAGESGNTARMQAVTCTYHHYASLNYVIHLFTEINNP